MIIEQVTVKPIGVVTIDEYHRDLPVFNPGARLDDVPHVMLLEAITENHLDANRDGAVMMGGGFRRVRVRKETENGESRLTAKWLQ